MPCGAGKGLVRASRRVRVTGAGAGNRNISRRRRTLLGLCRKGFRFERAIALAHEDLNLALSLFELSFAVGGELHALFKELDGLLEREVAAFEAAYDGLELLEGFFECGQSESSCSAGMIDG